jgi:hypothetical protein
VTEPQPAAKRRDLDPDERAELERLRGETAELRRRSENAHGEDGSGGDGRRRGRWRAVVAVVLIVLGCVLAPIAVLGVWAGTEVSNTDRWVATVEPLIHDPAVQDVLTDKITNEITSRLNLTGNIDQAADQLNSKGLTRLGSLLTTFGPQLTGGVDSFVHNAVHKVITSPAMANAWVQVNTLGHQGLIAVLSGQSTDTVSTDNGQVVLHIGPLIDVAKQNLVDRGFTAASKIPEVNPTVTLFQSDDLGKAQAGYRLINDLKIVLPIVALVLLGAGVYVARRRRRALLGAGLGLAASMLVLAIILLIARSIYLNSVPSSVLPSDAAAAAFDAFVHFIKVSLRVVLVVGLVVAIGAFITGPSRAAVQTRSGLKSGTDWIRNTGERHGVSSGPVGRWTYQHRQLLRIAAVALMALIFVFWGQPTAVVVIVLAVILLVLLGLIELIGRPPVLARPVRDG